MNRENEFPSVHLEVENSVHTLVMIDLWSVVSALLNLISNALYAAFNDGGKVTVSTAEDERANTLRIRIHNSGRPYTRAEIDKFLLRGETTKKEPGHLGLGLNIGIQAFRDAGGSCELRPAAPDGVETLCIVPVAPIKERKL